MKQLKLRCLLATKNKGKLVEVRDALRGLPLTFQTLDQYPHLPEPVENAATFAGNARLKADHYHRLTGVAAIADDSGLAVDALDGAPGIYSARFAPNDDARIRKLLSRLDRVDSDWAVRCSGARFVCAICLSGSAGRIEVVADVLGRIVPTPRGSNGFGYDPIFFYSPLSKTFAELTLAEKNRISHRAQALTKFRSKLGK